MKLKGKYSYSYILKYVPKNIDVDNPNLIQAREDVYDFMDGNISDSYAESFLKEIWNIVKDNPSEWCVCFIPASTEWRTNRRYTKLVKRIKDNIKVDVFLDAVNLLDREPMYTCQNKETLISNFVYNVNYYINKRVLLIDDLINTGKTFKRIADRLMESGALEVHGLFFAKTYHPTANAYINKIEVKKITEHVDDKK